MIKTLQLDKLMFHYSNASEYTAIVVTSHDFSKEVIFPLLSRIQSNLSSTIQDLPAAIEINRETLSNINFKDSLDFFINEAKKQHIDKLEIMEQGVDDIRNRTKANLDLIIREGQQIDRANERAEDLNSINKQLLRNTGNLKRKKLFELYKW
mmetsp:Transcript_6501/g.5695  ORF Transcript_6501/g.5695 Transcript_6501/m.5695 type:complete len:152 (+) Transcript_6501:115-570(+)